MGKICVSVCAKTAAELIEQIKRAEKIADVIEIRFDCLDESEFDPALRKLDELKCRKPFIATFRPKSDDALIIFSRRIFDNDEEKLKVVKATQYRFEGWRKIAKSKNVGFVDFETDIQCSFLSADVGRSWGDETSKVFSSDADKILTDKVVIISEHHYEKTPENLESVYENMLTNEDDGIQADIIKIAVQANDITDTIPIWKLLKRAKSENQEIIPIAMGEAGKWTRILGLAHGAFLTFASLDSDSATAPGQVSAKDLLEVYRVKELNEKTDVYGILGSNTSVSMSPYIHNFAFKYHNLNAVFVPLQVHDLDAFITRMVKPETREIELNFKGFSVTIPHKQSIIKHLDFIDETAEKIGAVNTVKIIDGKLHGFNTDADGFIEPLKSIYNDLKDAKVLILGAGGASKACVYALRKEGANVTVFGRAEIETGKLKPENVGEFDIIVNATPLGMKGKSEGETPIFAEQMKDAKLVYDLVYTPFETQFLKEADKVFVPKIGGMAMLVAQAIEQQKIWTGKQVPIKEISAEVLRRLK
jgi:3-dehydroquinate dehydratase / shikimate dehydrogenase